MPRESIVRALVGLAQTGTPGPDGAQVLDVGTSEFMEYLEDEVLVELVAAGGATCRFFEGAYGAGKTHLLSLVQARAVKRGMCVVRVDLSHALSLEDWHAITTFVLEKLELVVAGRRVVSLPRILEALAADGRARATRLAATPLPHRGVARAMFLIASRQAEAPAAREVLAAYLTGEPVTQQRFREAGISGVRGALSRRSAELVMRTVLNGLRALGVPGTVLLFDEAEHAFQVTRGVPSQRLRTAANLMRRFIDACATGGLTGVLAVFAVLPGFVHNCALAYDALGQRLDSGDGAAAAWRSPVLEVDDLSSTPTHEDFVEAAVDRFVTLLEAAGADGQQARPAFEAQGRFALEQHAGSGYRRDLIKRLATVAVSHLPPATYR